MTDLELEQRMADIDRREARFNRALVDEMKRTGTYIIATQRPFLAERTNLLQQYTDEAKTKPRPNTPL